MTPAGAAAARSCELTDTRVPPPPAPPPPCSPISAVGAEQDSGQGVGGCVESSSPGGCHIPFPQTQEKPGRDGGVGQAGGGAQPPPLGSHVSPIKVGEGEVWVDLWGPKSPLGHPEVWGLWVMGGPTPIGGQGIAPHVSVQQVTGGSQGALS